MTRTASVVVALLVSLQPAGASADDWLDRTMKSAEKKVKQRVDQRTNQALDKAVNKAEDVVRCAAGDQACVERAKREGKRYVVDGRPPPAAPPGAAPAALAPVAAAAAPSGAQPDLTLLKADFVPGERAFFYDDFTDMDADEPPRHWKARGAGFRLMAGDGFRELTTTSGRGNLTPNVTAWPRDFTVETEIGLRGCGDLKSTWRFLDKSNRQQLLVLVSVKTSGGRINVVRGASEVLGTSAFPSRCTQPVKLALWLQKGRLRVYVDGAKVVDANQVELPEIASAVLEADPFGPAGATVGYRQVRMAECAPDSGKPLFTDGRWVTHGILFDTDSARVRSESAAVVRLVAGALQADPKLALLIEGHTDGTGGADHNLDLSRRRAEAVKAILVSQFGVDGGRLSAAGLGQTKPVAPDDTPQGRAQNRRVEFVRQ